MKIAILGGSFNPIHVGHLALADEVCVSLGYDRIIFVPTFIPPHKTFAHTLSAQDRLEMVRRACMGDSRFCVDSCEIDRGGTSYTFDTVTFLEEKYAQVLDGKIGLIMGDDLIPGFHLWYKAQELAEKCTLILARRPQSKVDDGKSLQQNVHKGMYAKVEHSTEGLDIKKEKIFSNALFIQNPELVISSTDIRNRATTGRSFRYLVPDEVFKYIIDRKLYVESADPCSGIHS